jgi:hypothetical protein
LAAVIYVVVNPDIRARKTVESLKDKTKVKGVVFKLKEQLQVSLTTLLPLSLSLVCLTFVALLACRKRSLRRRSLRVMALVFFLISLPRVPEIRSLTVWLRLPPSPLTRSACKL